MSYTLSIDTTKISERGRGSLGLLLLLTTRIWGGCTESVSLASTTSEAQESYTQSTRMIPAMYCSRQRSAYYLMTNVIYEMCPWMTDVQPLTLNNAPKAPSRPAPFPPDSASRASWVVFMVAGSEQVLDLI